MCSTCAAAENKCVIYSVVQKMPSPTTFSEKFCNCELFNKRQGSWCGEMMLNTSSLVFGNINLKLVIVGPLLHMLKLFFRETELHFGTSRVVSSAYLNMLSYSDNDLINHISRGSPEQYCT